jgi:hypothetical protein
MIASASMSLAVASSVSLAQASTRASTANPPLSETGRAARADTLFPVDSSATRAARAPSTPGSVHVRIDGEWSARRWDRQPLWVVDGVPLGLLPDSSVDHTGALRALQEIDPARITSIMILKDATVPERFGRAGHDGVVLVTTLDSAAKTGDKPPLPTGSKRP